MGIYDRDYIQNDNISSATVSSFASKVYGWMTVGLLVTAFVAFGIYVTGAYVALMPLWWVSLIGTLVISFSMAGLANKISSRALSILFISYSAMQGVIFGIILPSYAFAYGGDVIWLTFFTAALIFGIATFYGVYTHNDLTNIGRLLNLALVGLVAVTFLFIIMSSFMDLTWFHLIISYIGLIIFVGLTAFDAQNIRSMSAQIGNNTNGEAALKMSIFMALKMYINVIMIFWYLLRILSSNRK